MPRLSAIIRPGIEGMNTDQPSYMIGENEAVLTQDAVAPEGILRQRRGWEYHGTAADYAADSMSVARVKHVLTDATVTYVTRLGVGTFSSGTHPIAIHNSGTTATSLYSRVPVTFDGVEYLYRTTYNDEAIFCDPDGSRSLLRCTGASTHGEYDSVSGSGTIAANEARLAFNPSTTFSTDPAVGNFVPLFPASGTSGMTLFPKIVSVDTSGTPWVGLSDIYAQSTRYIDTFANMVNAAPTVPCVVVNETGVGTSSSGAVGGFGTDWSTSAAWGGVDVSRDMYAIMFSPPGGTNYVGNVSGVTSDTSLSASIEDVGTKAPVRILRPCPFKDAAAHNGSLWGTGVVQFPNRVYVSPPGWNPSLPPGFVPPLDVSAAASSSNQDDFLLFPIDVPTPYDGDVNVAILSTPNPLLVLKRRAVHGIYGSYPSFSQEQVASGPGCIDIRSAVSIASIQAWAGEEGVFAYYDGQILDLTDGKMNREWRGLTKDFDFGVSDYCTIGEVYGHLLVHITTGGAKTQRTYAVDVRDPFNPIWISRWTNHNARYFFSAKVDGEPEELYSVSDDEQGRVMKSKGCFDGTGSYADDDDTEPVMKFHSGLNLVGAAEIEGEGLMTDLNVHANVLDTGSAAELGVQVVHGGGIGQGDSNETKVAGTITGDGVDRANRADFEINRTGRFQQVKLEVGTTTPTTTKVEIPEIVCEFIDLSMGT